MPIQTEHRPELAKPARELIQDAWKAHQAGGGSVPLTRLTAGLPGFSAADQAKVSARGTIDLQATDASRGRWTNAAAREISVKWQGITIKAPAVVRGDYLAFEQECVFLFDRDAALQGCKFFICVKFERIVVTPNRWTFDVEGDSNDIVYTF